MVLSIVGLGYVGLPLACEFSKKFQVIGFDINKKRIDELTSGFDRTREVDMKNFNKENITFTDKPELLKKADVHIVTVPTPVDSSNQPDLTPLVSACKSVGAVLKPKDIIVFESTVFPGCTEEVCVPILEKASGLKFNVDFFCGYSPERINPGDKERTVSQIVKVVSGSTPEVAQKLKALYDQIITAGTFLASSIKVAEAAKVIENTQRDINIAFVNELSLIFSKMDIDTREVLEAASTKWNFLRFYPGLVGGHCIGVDPFYLTHKAQSLGYHPEVILSGRRINDSMGPHVANQSIKLMIKKGVNVSQSKVLILGLTFKENCPDIRNSKVIDVIREFQEYGCAVDIHDPLALADEVQHEYGLSVLKEFQDTNLKNYDCVVLCVSHKEFLKFNFAGMDLKKQVLFDVKGLLDRKIVDGRL